MALVTDNTGGLWLFLGCGLLAGFTKGAGSGVRVLRNWNAAAAALNTRNASNNSSTTSSNNDTIGGSDARVVGLVHEFSRWLKVFYDDIGLVERIVDDCGRQVVYSYDQAGNLVRASQNGKQRTYELNQMGLIERVISACGVVECVNKYDQTGRVILQESPFGRRARFMYLPGGVCVVSDEDGKRANTWISDNYGRLIGVLDSKGNRLSLGYDARGNQIRVLDREGLSISRLYDEHSRLVKSLSAEGGVLEYEWDDLHRLVQVSSSAHKIKGKKRQENLVGDSEFVSGIVRFEYETSQILDRNPVRVIDPAGGVTQFKWDKGLLLECIDPTGVKVCLAYNEYGELTGIKTTNTNSADNGADARYGKDGAADSKTSSGTTTTSGWFLLERARNGLVARVVTPLGTATRYAYSASGLCEQVELPDGAVWGYEYDEYDRLSAVVAPDGGKTTLSYDPVTGVVSSWISPLGWQSSQEVDDLGNLSKLCLPGGVTWCFTHDSLSRLTKVEDPLGGVWSYDYDKNGVLKSITSPLEKTLSQRLDYANGIKSVYRNRQVQSVTCLDVFNRPTQHFASVTSAGLADANDFSGFDNAGLGGLAGGGDAAGFANPGAVISSATAGIFSGVDSSGILGNSADAVISALPDTTASTVPDASDVPSGFAGLSNSPGVATPALPASVGLRGYSVGDLSGVGLTYDARGLVVERVDSQGKRVWFDYDLATRLTQVTSSSGWWEKRSYDECGRLATITASNISPQTTSGEDSASIDSRIVSVVFDYDADSKLKSRTVNGVRTDYEYDPCGRLTRVVCGDRLVQSFQYDLCGRIIYCWDPRSGARRFKYDLAGNVVESVNPLGAVTKYEYVEPGWVSKKTLPDGSCYSYEYNQAGQVTKTIYPDESSTGCVYDQVGRLLVVTRLDGSCLTYEYDQTSGVRIRLDEQLLLETKRNPKDHSTTITHHLDSKHNHEEQGITNSVEDWAVSGVGTGEGSDGLQSHEGDDGAAPVAPVKSNTLGIASVTDNDGTSTSSDAAISSITAGNGIDSSNDTEVVGVGINSVSSDTSVDVSATTGVGVVFDGWQRPIRVHHGEKWIEYSYSQANQLTGFSASNGIQGVYEYDLLGRLTKSVTNNVRESVSTSVVYVYNQLGQPVQTITTRTRINVSTSGSATITGSNTMDAGTGSADTEVTGRQTGTMTKSRSTDTTAGVCSAAGVLDRVITCFEYDRLGRRVKQYDSRGAGQVYRWNSLGFLEQVVCKQDSRIVQVVDIDTDPLGNPLRINEHEFTWDTSSALPRLARVNQQSAKSFFARQPAGTVFASAGQLGGWLLGKVCVDNPYKPVSFPVHALEADGSNSFVTAGTAGSSGDVPVPNKYASDDFVTSGVCVTSMGLVGFNGLVFMGSRVYDSSLGVFLSRDPLFGRALPGCIGEHDAYGFAAGNPVVFSDPLGLEPITDMETLELYNQDREQSWWGRNWEYVAGVAMVAAGVGLMFVPGAGILAGAVSGALVNAGLDVITQKATTGQVNWKQTGEEALIGFATGAGGMILGRVAQAVGSSKYVTNFANSKLITNITGAGPVAAITNGYTRLVTSKVVSGTINILNKVTKPVNKVTTVVGKSKPATSVVNALNTVENRAISTASNTFSKITGRATNSTSSVGKTINAADDAADAASGSKKLSNAADDGSGSSGSKSGVGEQKAKNDNKQQENKDNKDNSQQQENKPSSSGDVVDDVADAGDVATVSRREVVISRIVEGSINGLGNSAMEAIGKENWGEILMKNPGFGTVWGGLSGGMRVSVGNPLGLFAFDYLQAWGYDTLKPAEVGDDPAWRGHVDIAISTIG